MCCMTNNFKGCLPADLNRAKKGASTGQKPSKWSNLKNRMIVLNAFETLHIVSNDQVIGQVSLNFGQSAPKFWAPKSKLKLKTYWLNPKRSQISHKSAVMNLNELNYWLEKVNVHMTKGKIVLLNIFGFKIKDIKLRTWRLNWIKCVINGLVKSSSSPPPPCPCI